MRVSKRSISGPLASRLQRMSPGESGPGGSWLVKGRRAPLPIQHVRVPMPERMLAAGGGHDMFLYCIGAKFRAGSSFSRKRRAVTTVERLPVSRPGCVVRLQLVRGGRNDPVSHETGGPGALIRRARRTRNVPKSVRIRRWKRR